MKAGLLREKIDIYRSLDEKTEFGNKTREWLFFRSARAGIIHKGGSRVVENDEIVHPVSKDFIVRFYVPIDENMKIKYEGKFYRIVYIDTNKYFNDKVISAELINE